MKKIFTDLRKIFNSTAITESKIEKKDIKHDRQIIISGLELLFAPIEGEIIDLSNVPEGAFSGLVVDCRGLDLERAMAPNIIDADGKTIYGSKNIMDTAIIQHGLVSYSRSDNPKDWPYVGNNPLVIKATGLADFRQNPVVRKEDGEAVLAAVQKYDFLKQYADMTGWIGMYSHGNEIT